MSAHSPEELAAAIYKGAEALKVLAGLGPVIATVRAAVSAAEAAGPIGECYRDADGWLDSLDEQVTESIEMTDYVFDELAEYSTGPVQAAAISAKIAADRRRRPRCSTCHTVLIKPGDPDPCRQCREEGAPTETCAHGVEMSRSCPDCDREYDSAAAAAEE